MRTRVLLKRVDRRALLRAAFLRSLQLRDRAQAFVAAYESGPVAPGE